MAKKRVRRGIEWGLMDVEELFVVLEGFVAISQDRARYPLGSLKLHIILSHIILGVDAVMVCEEADFGEKVPWLYRGADAARMLADNLDAQIKALI